MRARGAQVTDIAVLVVAADDGVKPQTQEAIDHVKAAGVPMIVAINKVDKGAQTWTASEDRNDRIGVQPEECGGDTKCVMFRLGQGGPRPLAGDVIVMAEVLELKANPEAAGSGRSSSRSIDPGRGPVVTILVSRGTLEPGDASSLAPGGRVGRCSILAASAPEGAIRRAGQGPGHRSCPRGRRARPRRRGRPTRQASRPRAATRLKAKTWRARAASA